MGGQVPAVRSQPSPGNSLNHCLVHGGYNLLVDIESCAELFSDTIEFGLLLASRTGRKGSMAGLVFPQGCYVSSKRQTARGCVPKTPIVRCGASWRVSPRLTPRYGLPPLGAASCVRFQLLLSNAEEMDGYGSRFFRGAFVAPSAATRADLMLAAITASAHVMRQSYCSPRSAKA